MIDLLIPYRAFLKLERPCCDNTVFRLHYRLTTVMLLISTLLVTSKQMFGEPIHCYNNDLVYREATNTYCWIYGTYTVREPVVLTVTKAIPMRYEKHKGKYSVPSPYGQMAYPGVGPYSGDKKDENYHRYYQWVCFVLLIQAAMFYLPRYLWKIWEAGTVKSLASESASTIVPKTWHESRKKELVNYFTCTNIYTHNLYALRFALCEIFNLINVVAQIFLLDIFLGGSFLTYGSAVAAFNRRPDSESDLQAIDPGSRYFPKITKCLFRYYGPTGGIQTKDFICILPINIVNEKIFILLWFWLVFLAIVSLFAVVYRIMVYSIPYLRVVLLMGQVRMKRYIVSNVVKKFNFGDWFLLHQLGKNMNAIMYRELIIEISKELEHKAVMI